MSTVVELLRMLAAFTYVMGWKVLWLPVWAAQRTYERAMGRR